MRERVVADPNDDITQLMKLDGSEAEHELFEHRGRCYRLLALMAALGEGGKLVRAALLVSDEAYPSACPIEVSRSIGHHLRRALQQGESTSLS